MSPEFWIYLLAFVPGIILVCTKDIVWTGAGLGEITVAILHPWPWCVIGAFCLIPLVYLVGKVVVSVIESACD